MPLKRPLKPLHLEHINPNHVPSVPGGRRPDVPLQCSGANATWLR
jgi:hypothetical protein